MQRQAQPHPPMLKSPVLRGVATSTRFHEAREVRRSTCLVPHRTMVGAARGSGLGKTFGAASDPGPGGMVRHRLMHPGSLEILP